MTRRHFLQSASAAAALATLPTFASAQERRPKVAAIFTELRFRSHAYNILIQFMGPLLFRGRRADPGVDVVSFYADQFPENDMARDVSKQFQVPLFKTIDEALCLGGKELAVDAVLLIGEHGNYPLNELGQRMYPRKEFFDQIVAVIKRAARPVPIFNDKHLSYRWDWAKVMYDEAQRLKIPLMAGSSVPLAERRPMIELPADANVEESVSIHGGGIESYDFHGFEVLQSLIEARRGGETGISRVELLTGDSYKEALEQGRWSHELVEAAMAAEREADMKRQTRPAIALPAEPRRGDHALVLTYEDGTKATVLRIGSTSDRWNFACRLKGQDKPLATAFYNGPWGNRNLFAALSHAIIHCFKTGSAPYPVERTLLASGVLDAAMHSHAAAGKPIDTPHLELAYQPQDFRAFRESGASWRVLTPDMPQPTAFEPGKG